MFSLGYIMSYPFDFVKGDEVCYTETPTQTGVVQRIKPLGVSKSIVIRWNNGPMHSSGQKYAFFQKKTTKIEKVH